MGTKLGLFLGEEQKVRQTTESKTHRKILASEENEARNLRHSVTHKFVQVTSSRLQCAAGVARAGETKNAYRIR
jgi:prophage antirepressor-like protein